MPVQYNKVVDDLFDSITKHSIELQRMSNYVQKDLAREYLKLSNELDGVIASHDFSRVTSGKRRKVMLNSVLKKGRAAIDKSNRALARVVKNNLIDVGNLEAQFSVGSINKAVTGKGSIKFATGKLGVKSISKMADNLIIQGAPQADLWARHGVNLQNKFKDIIRDGWQQQQDIPTIAQRIRGTAAAKYKDGIMNVSKHQANSLARTSIASVANQVREETYLANSDVIEGVQFIAVLDNNTTPICRAHAGDKWKMTPTGWLNVQGGHEYRQPPLHFNCRSTMVPMMYPPGEIPAAKRALVPEKKQKTLGKPLGIKVCKSPCKYVDADAWLRTQGVDYQKDVLGKAYTGWRAGRLSFKRMVTQKGRLRNTDELAKIYASQDLIPAQIQALKTTDKFKPYKGASKGFKDELAKTEKGAFLKMEERLMTGKQVSRAESDQFGRILRNADPADLEYKGSFKPKDFDELLGNRAKRLAFYNHTAKRFERIKKLHKGDLAKRKTGKLNDIDQRVLDELKDKIVADTTISATNKKILLEMFDESSRIVGSQRSLPMIESLFTLARKTDFSDIDDFIGYLNNATGKSVNSYFSRAKRLEIRLTASTEKAVRFNTLSENAKTLQYAEINRTGTILNPSVKLADANKVKSNISKIGKRRLRDFDGQTPSAYTVDLELTMQENVDLFLRYINKEVRMSKPQADAFMKRIRAQKYREYAMTKSEKLHHDRVQFIIKRTQPGDKIDITDAIMDSPLFKEWKDNAWTGRGFPPAIRKEVGAVLGDAETYQALKHYVTNRSISGKRTLSQVINKASSKSTRSTVSKMERLLKLDATKRKKYIKLREDSVERSLNKEGFFARLGRAEAKITKTQKVAKQRELAAANWEDMSDAKFVGKIKDSLDELIINNSKRTSSPFYTEANLTLSDDTVKLSQLVNKELFSAVEKGKPYINVAEDLGNNYYYQFRNVIKPDKTDAIRMGHFLIESATNSKIVRRVKVPIRVKKDSFKPRNQVTWRLEEVDKSWKDAFLANKNNYDVDGLPSIGKAPKVGTDGLYVNSGRATIRKTDKEWAAKQFNKPSSKPWVKNLEYESGTGIRVNGYVYDTMTELEKRGKSIIPKKALNKTDVVARSKYDSYMRARTSAKGMRDEKFFNRMSNDKFGRTYADTVGLQWQGDDITKGLMMYDEGVKLGKNGYKDFKRNFMNIAGFDKIPMKTRRKLFDLIDDKLIIKTVKDPIKYDWWYTQTDWIETGVFKSLKGLDSRDIADVIKLAKKANPRDEGAFQLLALMKERAAMIKWVKDGNKLSSFVSHLQSAADGTTNVLQHFAGITRDRSIAKVVNMVKRRTVADAYIQLRNLIDDIGRSMDTNNPLKKYIDVPGLTHAKRRKSVKKALMTAQYNAQAESLGKSYFYELKDVQVKGKFIFQKAPKADVTAVGRILYRSVEKQYPQATKIRYGLNKFAEAHEISGFTAIEVKTPMGFPFKQSYVRTYTSKLELRTSSGGRMILNVQKEAVDDVIKSKEIRRQISEFRDKRKKLSQAFKDRKESLNSAVDELKKLESELGSLRRNNRSLSVKQAQIRSFNKEAKEALRMDKIVRDLNEELKGTIQINYPKQNRAFAPNIIHAMDSTHKSLVVNELARKYGIKNFSMIHDSFGTSFGNMDLLQKVTRSTFSEMYSGNKNFMKFLYKNFDDQGVKMRNFLRNPDNPSQKIKYTVDNLKKYKESGHNVQKWKDPNGRLWLVEDIDIKSFDFGNDPYDFKDFMELEYFFH